MKHLLWLLMSTSIIAPAFALQIPTAAKKGDPRTCDVIYNPDEITAVAGSVGNTVTIKFGEHERVQYVSASDTVNLKYSVAEGSNLVWLKGAAAMPPQPISIRTQKDDGTPRDYTLQWSAIAEPATPPATSDKVASNDPAIVPVAATTGTAPTFCYSVRYQYPGDVAAENAAKWRVAAARQKNDAAEIALRQAQAAAAHNVRYVAMGDMQIGPSEIYDDGNTTTLQFPGNMRIPTLYSVTPDGKEAVIGGLTTEDNGVVKIHNTLPIIRLRDGTLVLCMFNRGYGAPGTDPGTGTTDPNTRRTVGASR